MRQKIIYKKIKFVDNVLRPLIKEKRTFELASTSYTKKLTYGKKKIIFNADGFCDLKLLALINKVRKDAKNYIYPVMPSFTPQFDLFRLPEEDDIIEKIDIKSAYWEYAKKQKILSEDTVKFFETRFKNLDSEHTKSVRLKALGSLATRKIIQKFIEGILINELTTVITEDTRNLYMSITKGIDMMLRSICYNNPGVVYYYVDCLFVKKGQFSDEAINYLLKSGYKVTTEETKLRKITIGDTLYLESASDQKRYLTRIKNGK